MQSLSDLSPAQMKAVTCPEGHLLISAAAGTGKTSTIAARIIWLQNEKAVKPHEIIAITFSRTARQQITDKMEKMCLSAGSGSPVRTYTFHGLAYRIIRLAVENGETWLRPGFNVVVNSQYQDSSVFQNHYKYLFNEVSDTLDKEARIELYPVAIDMLRQGHKHLDGIAEKPEDLPEDLYLHVQKSASELLVLNTSDISSVWRKYNTILKNNNFIDYPGLIIEAIRILKVNSSASERARNGIKYIIADEYQDTSRAQEALLCKLAGKNICVNVVGDREQTIYSFNGSDINNITEFNNRFSNTNLPVLDSIELKENYRSAPSILTVANRIISDPENISRNKLIPAQVALPEPVETYRRKNMDVMLVYTPRLELCADYVAGECSRLINEEKINPDEITILVRKNTEFSPQGQIILDKLKLMGVESEIKTNDAERTEAINNYINELCQSNYDAKLDDLCHRLGAGEFDSALNNIKRDDVNTVIEEIMSAGAEYAYEAIDFLFDSYEHKTENYDPKNIQVRTVHSAKGAEFRIVFLLYLADRQFPHGETPDIEEERRLFYVGITRAQERLYIIGRNGIHGPDFFGECIGSSVKEVNYIVPGGQEHFGNKTLHDEDISAIEQAKKQHEEAELRQLEELRKMFDEEDLL